MIKSEKKDNFKPRQTSVNPKRMREKKGRRREEKREKNSFSTCTRITSSGRDLAQRNPTPWRKGVFHCCSLSHALLECSCCISHILHAPTKSPYSFILIHYIFFSFDCDLLIFNYSI